MPRGRKRKSSVFFPPRWIPNSSSEDENPPDGPPILPPLLPQPHVPPEAHLVLPQPQPHVPRHEHGNFKKKK